MLSFSFEENIVFLFYVLCSFIFNLILLKKLSESEREHAVKVDEHPFNITDKMKDKL